jgi:hypothetical protein
MCSNEHIITFGKSQRSSNDPPWTASVLHPTGNQREIRLFGVDKLCSALSIGTVLLVYVLLRFQAWRSGWAHRFSRRLTLLRAARWLLRDIGALLQREGTAGGRGGTLAPPHQSELPGFAVHLMGQA